MYFALFILEQLKKEVHTMMSGAEEGGEAVNAHKHKYMHTQTDTMTLHLQGLQVQESSETVLSYILNSVVMKMPGKAKLV